MKRTVLLALGGVLAAATFASGAQARPATFIYVGSICDTMTPTINHELGNPPLAGGFPPDQAIESSAIQVTQQGTCTGASQDTGLPDFRVSITNLTGKAVIVLQPDRIDPGAHIHVNGFRRERCNHIEG